MSVEGPADQFAQQLVRARLRLLTRERTQIGDGQVERRSFEWLLDRRAVGEQEPGAQDLVPLDDELESAPQCRLVQGRASAHERRHVVGAEPRHDPVEQEQAFLWEGEPPRSVVLIREDRLRRRVRAGCLLRGHQTIGSR